MLLAFAASSELQAHRLAILALKLETDALAEAFRNRESPLVSVTGTDKHIRVPRSMEHLSHAMWAFRPFSLARIDHLGLLRGECRSVGFAMMSSKTPFD